MAGCGINITRSCNKNTTYEHILFNLLVPLFLGKVVLDNSSIETWSNVLLTLLVVVIAWNVIRLLFFHFFVANTFGYNEMTRGFILWGFLLFVMGSIAFAGHVLLLKLKSN